MGPVEVVAALLVLGTIAWVVLAFSKGWESSTWMRRGTKVFALVWMALAAIVAVIILLFFFGLTRMGVS